MLPDVDDRILLQKWAGIALFGINLPQRILIFDGTPGRGKGVLLRVLRGIIGAENISELRTQHLGERFELNRFVGKTLLAASDVAGDFLMQKWASILKSIVGGDPLTPEAKGSNETVDIEGNYSVLIVSNSRLRCRLDGDVDAWRRRLMILRTNAPPVTKRIAQFEKILLRDEGPGILQWALGGFEMAMADISDDGDFHLTEKQRQLVDDLMSESNSLERFVKTMIRQKGGSTITVDEIEKKCADFCADRGWQIPEISKLHREIPDLMLREHGSAKSNSIKRADGTRKGFRGVAFTEDSK